MNANFWCLKDYVEHCLQFNSDKFNCKNYSVSTIGKGHHGVNLYTFGISGKDLIKECGNHFEDQYCNIYLTSGQFDCSAIYVNVKKK